MGNTIKQKFQQFAAKFHHYLWNHNSQQAFHDWLKLIMSFRGLWCFIPGILGVLFVYWAEANGYSKSLLGKENNEILAILLMSMAVLLFLVRSFIYRLEIDYILLALAANFLCREVHFAGTDDAVVIVAALILVWALYWKDRILGNIGKAKLVQLALTGTVCTYFFSILIARRVFKAERIPLLPNENYMHVQLEEVMENIAHIYLIFIGLAAFFSISKIGLDKPAKKDN